MRITSLVTHSAVRAPGNSELKNSFHEKDYDITLTAGRIFEIRSRKTKEAIVCVPMENCPSFVPAPADAKAADKPSKQV